MAFTYDGVAQAAMLTAARLVAGITGAGFACTNWALGGAKSRAVEVTFASPSSPRQLWCPPAQAPIDCCASEQRMDAPTATSASGACNSMTRGGSSSGPCSGASTVSLAATSVASEVSASAKAESSFQGFSVLSVGEKLGAGAFGEVLAVEIEMDDGSTREAVMKVLYDPGQVADHEREVAALEAVRGCPYVVQMYGYGWRDGLLCIVMERAKGVPLKKLLDDAGKARGRRSRTVLPYSQIARLARQLLTAVEAMAARGLLHADLKPANIMYDQSTGDITIVDLGCVCWQRAGGLSHHAGTPGFISLEMEAVLYRRPCEYRPCLQSDVASVGCVLCAATAFADCTGMVVSVRDYEDQLPSYVPPDLQQLIYGCLEANPAHRLTPTAALAEPFLARFPGS